MFSCMDSRLIVTRLVQADVGDMLLVRNAGNLVPNNDSLSFDTVTTEPGALELGCVMNKIRHVVVCGHSDCKVLSVLLNVCSTLVCCLCVKQWHSASDYSIKSINSLEKHNIIKCFSRNIFEVITFLKR